MKSKSRVFLVDDEAAVRRGLELLIVLEPDLIVCGEAEGESQALEGILASKPDVVVVDLSLKEGNGLSLIQELRRVLPKLRILVLTTYDRGHVAAAAFAAGADGYVTKEEGADKVIEAVHSVLAGEPYISEAITAKAPNLLPGGKSRGKIRSG